MERITKLPPNLNKKTTTEEFWSHYTVNPIDFKSVKQSLDFLEWRFKEYNQAKDFMEMYGTHNDEIIVDFGCGPGNDLVGFSVYTNAKKIIGYDVSLESLSLAGRRLDLHKVPPSRVDLIQVSDENPKIPAEDSSIDFIHCVGSIHHASYPDKILSEFFRILKNKGRAIIMVYNYESVWLHLYVAYVQMIKMKNFKGLDIRKAFSKCVDTKRCPRAVCYKSDEFIQLCKRSGFSVEFVGGYFANREIQTLKDYGDIALKNSLFKGEHRDFITKLKYDLKGFPLYNGKYAGYGGVYKLLKE